MNKSGDLRNDLVSYIKFFVSQLNIKKKTADDETKDDIEAIILTVNESVIPDVYKIISINYVKEYGEYIEEFALKKDIILPPFEQIDEWKHLYRISIIDDITEL